jgi:hypothetical protein
MNISLVKRISSLLVVSAFVCAFTQPAAVTNFSGTWALNEGKSELGQGGGRGVASKIVAEQKADAISLTKTSKNFQGEEVTAYRNLIIRWKRIRVCCFWHGQKKINAEMGGRYPNFYG